MTEQAKPTPGPMIAAPTGYVMAGYRQPYAVGMAGNKALICGCFGDIEGGNMRARANAELIAEAFNVLHETGMTPRELAAQRDSTQREFQKVWDCAAEANTKVAALTKQRDALLAFANRARISIGQAAEGKPLSEWETLRRLCASAIASVKGGAA